MLTLRDYQLDAIKSNTHYLFERGYQAVLNHLATGLGKGVIAVGQVMENIDLQTQRVIFLVHTQEIIFQQRLKFLQWMPELAGNDFTPYSYPGVGIVMNKHNDVMARIILATRQTLSGAGDEVDFKRLDEILNYGDIDLLMFDEGHHSVARSYLKMRDYLLKRNPDMKILGFTATPVRPDELALSQMFQMINVRRDIRWGIRQGYLCDIRPPLLIETNIALPDGRGSVDERARALDVKNWSEILYNAYVEHGEDRPGVFFLPSIEHSKDFCQYLQEQGIKAAHVDGSGNLDEFGNWTPKSKRQEILSRFNEGKIQLLCNYGVLTEGWDAPRVAIIGWARPTESPVLLTQAIGRGTRPHKDKKDLLVLDFTLKGVEIVTTGSLLGHTWKEEEKPVEDETEVLLEAVDIRDIHEPDTLVHGDGVVVKIGRLFKKLDEAWYADGEGYMSLGCSDTDALVITPPTYTLAAKLMEGMRVGTEKMAEEPNNPTYMAFYRTLEESHEIVSQFALWHLKKEANRWKVRMKPMAVDSSLELLFDWAAPIQAELVNPMLANKKKSWRYDEPSEGQMNYLKNLQKRERFELPDGRLTKGLADQLITHYITVPKVKRMIEKRLADCGDWGRLKTKSKAA